MHEILFCFGCLFTLEEKVSSPFHDLLFNLVLAFNKFLLIRKQILEVDKI
jgi:hypothetical protein